MPYAIPQSNSEVSGTATSLATLDHMTRVGERVMEVEVQLYQKGASCHVACSVDDPLSVHNLSSTEEQGNEGCTLAEDGAFSGNSGGQGGGSHSAGARVTCSHFAIPEQSACNGL